MIKIKVNRINCSDITGNELKIYFFGDQHIGSKSSNIKKINRDIEKIRKDKNAKVILMGDLVNCNLLNSVGAGSFDDVMNPEEQIELAISMLEPIKNKIIGVHNGNHSYRVYKSTTLNPEKIIAKAFNVPFLGDTCFHHLRFGKQTYILFTAHGSTGAVTLTGSLNACLKYANFANADIYAMGHVHKLSYTSDVYLEVDKKDKTLSYRKRYFILTGGYLNWKGSYGEQKNYQPLKLGCASVVITADKKSVRVNV